MTTLAEYKYLGNAQETRMGIAQTLVKESPWLRELPFVELANNNISRYKMETSDGGASTHAVDDTWSVLNPTWEYREAGLAIIGDNVSVDNFGELAAGPENVMAAAIELKTKGVAQTFDKLAIYGRTTSTASLSNANNFKGLLRLIAEAESSTTTDLDGWLYSGNEDDANNKQVVCAVSGDTAALTLVMIDSLLDTVRPKATHLICSRLIRRRLMNIAQSAGENLEVQEGKLGQLVTRYGEQIVLIDDQIKDNFNEGSALVTAIASYDYDQAISTTDKDTSPIFAVRMAEDGLCGINGDGMIQVVDLGEMESKDAKGKRIKFYCGMRLTNKRAAAVLVNANYAG